MAGGRRRRHKVLGRQIGTAALAGALFLGSPYPVVQAKEDFALSREKPEGEAYVLFSAKDETCEVEEGDSLWKIAQRIWGDGRLYGELYEQNRETVSDPNLILPGQILQTTSPYYIKKRQKINDAIGIQMGQYQFDMPQGCTVGVLGNESGANFALFGSEEGYDIACLVREKEAALDGPEAYAAWEKAVKAYAEESYGEAVQNLQFEQYLSEKGEPVWLYSYTYVIDLSAYQAEGSTQIDVSAGLKQSRNMQAEFVGFSIKAQGLDDKVRYVTASFEETMDEGDVCMVNEQNMQIYPSVAWKAPSFNAFAWVESYFDDMLTKITGGREEEESRKDGILRRMREGKGSG